MGVNMKKNLKIIELKGKVLILDLIKGNILENEKIIKCMVKEFLLEIIDDVVVVKHFIKII